MDFDFPDTIICSTTTSIQSTDMQNIIDSLSTTHITPPIVINEIIQTKTTNLPIPYPTKTKSNNSTPTKKKLIIKPSIRSLLVNTVATYYASQKKKNIWRDSPWRYISKLENDYVGKVGESFIQSICESAKIPSTIDGTKTKAVGGGTGDGTIKGKCIEIKTARLGTGKSASFQHELGEKPWISDYMIFIDIAPESFYITIMPNFSEEQYKSCCKCEPYFPSKSFTWRKQSGAFKFDTTKALNDIQSQKDNAFTFKWNESSTFKEISEFINRIIN
jgi:hypothetical protein